MKSPFTFAAKIYATPYQEERTIELITLIMDLAVKGKPVRDELFVELMEYAPFRGIYDVLDVQDFQEAIQSQTKPTTPKVKKGKNFKIVR